MSSHKIIGGLDFISMDDEHTGLVTSCDVPKYGYSDILIDRDLSTDEWCVTVEPYNDFDYRLYGTRSFKNIQEVSSYIQSLMKK